MRTDASRLQKEAANARDIERLLGIFGRGVHGFQVGPEAIADLHAPEFVLVGRAVYDGHSGAA